MPSLAEAKDRLDHIINIARVQWYKPIQIAEVLYKSRLGVPDLDTSVLETYRVKSRRWRDEVCSKFLQKQKAGSTSSSRYQDNVWEANAMTPDLLTVLDSENKKSSGAVEKYIYLRFQATQEAVAGIITIVNSAHPQTFNVSSLFQAFQSRAIRRSIDKVYEVVVYSLMETIVIELNAQVTISVPKSKGSVLAEFSDLSTILLGLSSGKYEYTIPAHVYRVGITNAADRGLDIWANFGPAIQVKHMSLNPKLARDIVDQVESDNIIVVCTVVEKETIETVLKQTSWIRRVRDIVTEEKLAEWYTRCLRGKHSSVLAQKLLDRLSTELKREFSQAAGVVDFIKDRRYMEIPSPALWNVDLLQNIHESEETQGLEYSVDNPDARTIYEYLEDQ
jgi:type II restriction enzyme